MALFGFLRRAVGRIFGWPPVPPIRHLHRQQLHRALEKAKAEHARLVAELQAKPAPPIRRLPSPLVRTIRPPGRRMPPAAARAVARPMRYWGGGRGGGAPPPVPAPFLPGDLSDWHLVSSSWIGALRFVPLDAGGGQALTADAVKNPRGLRGYVDMKVSATKYPVYRYGPGIMWRDFDKWLAAASKGKHWWRVWTLKWSPATKI